MASFRLPAYKENDTGDAEKRCMLLDTHDMVAILHAAFVCRVNDAAQVDKVL